MAGFGSLAPSGANFGTTSSLEDATMPETFVNPMVKSLLAGLLTLPQRAIQNSQFSLDSGTYDPAVPMEAGMNMIGAASPFSQVGAVGAAGGRLRSGAVKTKLPMDDVSRLGRAKEMGFEDGWYHGANRSDRLVEGGQIDPRRASSGPMPFFTDSPVVASNYATGKADTSIMNEGAVKDFFTVSPKDLGIGGRRPLTVEQSWHYLPQETKADILSKVKRVGYENPAESSGGYMLHPPGVEATLSPSHFDYIMKTEARGNPLTALRDMWHDGGNLIGAEGNLAQIYKLSGYPHPISEATAPWVTNEGVMPAMLRMVKPLDTGNQQYMAEHIIPKLEQMFKGDRSKKTEFGTDMWDKNSRYTPREWVQQAKQDYAKGDNSFVFTSIPDKVTKALQQLGHDGIIDSGGKMGGPGHRVAIPFTPDQVRSRFAQFDPAKLGSKDLLAGIGGAAAFGSLAPRIYDEGM